MNFRILRPLPRQVVIAFSGGVDSVAAADFLSRNHTVCLAYMHHGTEHSEQALGWVSEYARSRQLALEVGHIIEDRPSDQSWEEHWREHRYQFLQQFAPQTVITAHHLNDAVETYVWSALHGNPRTIPVQRDNIVRPFLTTPKSTFVDWCRRRELTWCEDHSNTDTRYTRNYIRHQLMPHALRVNPGLETTVRKMVMRQLTPLT